MNPIYRFYLTIQGIRREACPLYGNDIYKVYALENDQQYYRTTLGGKFKFVKDDYDFIMQAPFDTTIYVDIVKSNDNGRSFSIYFTGKFLRTDCLINVDNKILQTSFTAIDQYENIINGLEKEYDLIKLAPEIREVYITKRPAVQIYISNDNVLTSFVGGTYFEQEVDKTEDESFLTETCRFNRLCYAREIIIKPKDVNSNLKIEGSYYGRAEQSDIKAVRDTGLVEEVVYSKVGDDDTVLEFYNAGYLGTNPEAYIGVKIYNKYTGELYLEYSYLSFLGEIITGEDYTAYDESDGYLLYFINNGIYARVLLDTEEIGYNISPEDIAGNNMNYKYVNPANVSYNNNIFIHCEYSSEPTEYGLHNPNEYFTKPKLNIKSVYPVGRSQWVNASIWFATEGIDEYLESYATLYKLKHAYPIVSCIKRLLTEIAPEISFEESILYSDFLFSKTNPISGDNFGLYITPKSNILKGDYDQPAQKAPITLKEIFDMLKNCFRCYWFVENSRLRIEHISYFKNGMNYVSELEPGLNLLKVYEPKTNKPWSFGVNEYKFEKSKMPERYQFSWMDDQTEPFDGLPIDILSGYVEKGNIENVSIAKFSSDLDFMLISPESFSKDGFALVAASQFDIFGIIGGNYSGPRSVYVDKVNDFANNSWNLNSSLFNKNDSILVTLSGFIQYTNGCEFKIAFIKQYVGDNDSIVIDPAYTVLSETIAYTTTTYNSNFSVTVSVPKGVNRVGIFSISYNSPYTVEFLSLTTVELIGTSFIKRDIRDNAYNIQNGFLSFIDLQPKYYTKDLPATHVRINEQDVYISTKNVKRNRLQDLKFPSGKNDINPMQLIKTELGNGQVDKVKINLSSRIAEATLRHYNE